ncbi:PRA1 family protein F2 [Acorus calamus]|uniref:PRA1 family protein n=1 Tax=Acorus calamus TaxID=4465 RepID=A0AAV9EMS7_ACOCL|nr:PRA1 family protein F2 [Acorus calamus]
MTTTYGTIPTSSPPPSSSGLEFLSRAKARGHSALATRRPWKELLHLHAFSLPHSFRDALSRVRTNLNHFRMNYAIIILFVIFVSLLWHPISLIVFIVMMCAWLFLYFLRDEPIVVFHRTINDRWVLAVLSVVTLVALLLTHVTANVLGALGVGVFVVVVHAVFKTVDDRFLGEEDQAEAYKGREFMVESSSSS